MAGKRTSEHQARIALTLWAKTVIALRKLSDQTGKPQTELAHEAVTLLEGHYAQSQGGRDESST